MYRLYMHEKSHVKILHCTAGAKQHSPKADERTVCVISHYPAFARFMATESVVERQTYRLDFG